MMTIDVGNPEALLSHYADWLKHLDAEIADTRAKIARLAAGKKAQSPDKAIQTPAWLFGEAKSQPAATELPTNIPAIPIASPEEMPVEGLASDDGVDEPVIVELDARPTTKPEDGWL